MRCPHCETENRDDRPSCYHCGKDLAMLRLINNQARQHFNRAVDHAESARFYEALGELNNALELNARLSEVHVLRGTILARLDRMNEAKESWDAALGLNPQSLRAHRYLLQAGEVGGALPVLRRARLAILAGGGAVAVAAVLVVVGFVAMRDPDAGPLRDGYAAFREGDLAAAHRIALSIREPRDRQRLMGAVEATIEERMAAAEALAPLDPVAAAERLAALAAHPLPPAVEKRVESAMARLGQDMLSRIGAGYSADPATADSLGAANALRERAVAALPSIANDAQRLAQSANEGIAARSEESAERAAAEATRDPDAALASLRDARRLHDATGSADSPAIRRAEEAIAASLSKDVEQAEASTNVAALELVLVRAERLARDGDSPTVSLLRSRVQDVLGRIRVDALAADLNDALDRGDLIAIADAHGKLEALGTGLSSAQAAKLADAQRLGAVRGYQRLMAMGDRIEAGDFTKEEAAEIMRLAEIAEGHLPAHMAARAEENLIFFQMFAAMKLELDAEVVAQYMGKLAAIEPKSAYVDKFFKPFYSADEPAAKQPASD